MTSRTEKVVGQPAALPRRCSSREGEAAALILSGDVLGDAAGLFERLPLTQALASLRMLSGLTVVMPEDKGVLEGVLAPEVVDALSAGTSRFPRFREIALLAEKVRCYGLCHKLRDRKAVANLLGWRVGEVNKAYKEVYLKLRVLRGRS